MKIKTNISTLLATAFLGLPFLANAAAITHIDQNFESLTPGSLPSGAGWGGTPSQGSIVEVSGNKALQVVRNPTGSLSYTTNGGPNTALVLSDNSQYEWSFDCNCSGMRT